MQHALNSLAVALVGLLAGAVVLTELRKPRQQRSWQGLIFGLVPYDLRRPTSARLRQEFWDATDSRIVRPHVFGIGWGLNFYALRERLRHHRH